MKKHLFAITVTLFLLAVLSGCNFPSEKKAEDDVKEIVDVSFTYVKTEENDDTQIITYKDENGLEFHYISEKRNVGLDGATFYKQVISKCDYAECFIESKKDSLCDICDACGLFYEYDAAYYKIQINSKEDVKTASILVCDLQDTAGDIPIKAVSTRECPLPTITILLHTKPIDSFSFGEHTDSEVIYDRIISEYAQEIKEGRIDNDMTDSELAKILSQRLYVVYNGKEQEDMYFYYDEEKDDYFMELNGLMPEHATFMGIKSFADFCRENNIEYEQTGTGVTWKTDGDTYITQIAKDRNHVKIYKDGQHITSVSIYYEGQESYLCRMTQDEFCDITNTFCNTDNAKARVYFTSKADD